MVIDTYAQLVEFCALLRESPAVFLDTEFVSESRYYPELGTVQMGNFTHAAILDPLAVSDLSPLAELLVDPHVTKVFHAAVQDLFIFYRLFQQPVAPLFDTQVAASLLSGDEQISFGNLVERLTGTRLEKAHGFTDWLRRPLSPGQIEYALDDVRLLAPVYAAQMREMETRERTAWAREEFARMENPALYAPVDPQQQYLRIRGVDRVRGAALSALRELAAWREETARSANVPLGRVARDEVLIELARRPRQHVRELFEIRGLQAQQVERFGAGMIEAVNRGKHNPPPRQQRHGGLPPSLEPTVDFLVLCLRSLADELSVAPGAVATRGDLAALVMAGEKAEIPLMRGWRREALGDALLATLEGKATARILPGTRRVHLEWHH
jgi:ribonuclease D